MLLSLCVCISYLPHVCVHVKRMHITGLPYACRYEQTLLIRVDITHVCIDISHTPHTHTYPSPFLSLSLLPSLSPFSLLLPLSTPSLPLSALSQTHTQTRMDMHVFPACVPLPGRSPAAHPVQCHFATLFHLLAQGTGTSVALEVKMRPLQWLEGQLQPWRGWSGHWRTDSLFFPII